MSGQQNQQWYEIVPSDPESEISFEAMSVSSDCDGDLSSNDSSHSAVETIEDHLPRRPNTLVPERVAGRRYTTWTEYFVIWKHHPITSGSWSRRIVDTHPLLVHNYYEWANRFEERPWFRIVSGECYPHPYRLARVVGYKYRYPRYERTYLCEFVSSFGSFIASVENLEYFCAHLVKDFLDRQDMYQVYEILETSDWNIRWECWMECWFSRARRPVNKLTADIGQLMHSSYDAYTHTHACAHMHTHACIRTHTHTHPRIHTITLLSNYPITRSSDRSHHC